MINIPKQLLEIQCLEARLHYLKTMERLRNESMPDSAWKDIVKYHDDFHKPSDFIQSIKDIYGKDFS